LRRLALGLVCLSCALPGPASGDGAQPSDFALYETESTRSPSRVIETPAAISVVVGQEISRARPAVALDEALDLVPGAFAQGGRNFAQDSRVSIRGFGARAQFGVRGVRMLVDGVPTTLADGQSEVDSLDLAFVERIDVVRSQVSSLWGGGGGGLVAIDTLSPTDEPAYGARVLFGSDHLSRYALTATGKAGATGYAFGLARTRATGYRDHARAEQTALLGKLERELESGLQLGAIFSSVVSPQAQDPGGLTAAEVSADRTQAAPNSLTFDTDEEVEQHKLSLHLRQPLGPASDIRAMVYGLVRDFENLLPFRQVAFDRNAGGAALSWSTWAGPLRFATGVDFDVQMDHRENWVNTAGGGQGALLLDQSETVRAFGTWARGELELGGGFDLIGGLRWDWVEFVAGDRLVADPATDDASDRLRFRELSPQLGLHWGRSTALQVYANLGSAFGVPTTTELADIDSTGVLVGGFQDDFDAERSTGVELGVKGLISDRLAYDAALFDLYVRHVPVGDEVVAGTFDFRDAGKVRRRGAELALTLVLTPELDARLGYTYADYRYRDYRVLDQDPVLGPVSLSFSGNREPNVPQQALGAELRWAHHSGLFATLALRHFSDIEVDDPNNFESDGATLSDFRVGYDWRGESLRLQPFVGVRNWSQAEYDQTIRPNGANNRYYEPAPLAELYVGVDLRFE
jgi:iron complex outermembrane receptor protein